MHRPVSYLAGVASGLSFSTTYTPTSFSGVVPVFFASWMTPPGITKPSPTFTDIPFAFHHVADLVPRMRVPPGRDARRQFHSRDDGFTARHRDVGLMDDRALKAGSL